MPPAPRPLLPGLRPLPIQLTPLQCRGSACILCLQRPGQWPPGKVVEGVGGRCHPQRDWSCQEEMGHSSNSLVAEGGRGERGGECGG